LGCQIRHHVPYSIGWVRGEHLFFCLRGSLGTAKLLVNRQTSRFKPGKKERFADLLVILPSPTICERSKIPGWADKGCEDFPRPPRTLSLHTTRLRRVFIGKSTHTQFRLAVLNVPFIDDDCSVFDETSRIRISSLKKVSRTSRRLIVVIDSQIRASSELYSPQNCPASAKKNDGESFGIILRTLSESVRSTSPRPQTGITYEIPFFFIFFSSAVRKFRVYSSQPLCPINLRQKVICSTNIDGFKGTLSQNLESSGDSLKLNGPWV
jgi:hypothetical protein